MEEAENPKPEETEEVKDAPQQAAADGDVVEEPTAPEPEAEPEFSAQDIPIPPATFEFLVLSLRSQAEMQLGLLHFGEEKDRPAPQLPIARHTIDLMAMLLEKTKGNLSVEEERMLTNSLTELRFRVVQASQGGGS